jgi:hypothetical protein
MEIFRPKAPNTFITVSNLGFESGFNALYKLSLPNPVSVAILLIPLALAISPIAESKRVISPSSITVLKYAAMVGSSFKYSETSKTLSFADISASYL